MDSQVKQENSGPPSSWREGLYTMSEKLAAVLKTSVTGIKHDIKFLVGQGEEIITCHKFLLRVASPVFQAMFSKPFKGGYLSTVKIPDVDAIGFQNILTYVYTGKCSVEIKDAATTMYAAHKYDIQEMVCHCSEILSRNLSIYTAATVYQTAVIFDDTPLQEKATKTIVENFGKVMKTPDFLDLSSENVCTFIRMDNIEVRSEVELFIAVLDWSKHQCERNGKDPTTENITEALVNVVQHIRFPTMTAKEFATVVEPTGILCEKDCYSLFKYFSLAEDERASIIMPYIRKRRIHTQLVFWRIGTPCLSLSCSPDQWETFQITRLSGTKRMYLNAVSLLAPSSSGILPECQILRFDDVYLTMHLWTRDLNNMIANNPYFIARLGNKKASANFTGYPKSGEMYEIVFATPVELPENIGFSFSFEFNADIPVSVATESIKPVNYTSQDGTASLIIAPCRLQGEEHFGQKIASMKVDF